MKLRHGFITRLIFFLGALAPTGAYSEVITSISPSGTTLTAPDGKTVNQINITGGTYKQGNLFHRFEKFSIGKEQIANFHNTSSLSVGNIVSYVTGGLSKIDGEINSREYGNANLFLVNPKGIVFGASAKLEVGGSFYATTADTIKFQDGSTLFITTEGDPVLSSAPVTAFGFLDDASAISVDGARLEIDKGQVLAIVAGDITIGNGATLKANGGEIKLLSRTNSNGITNIEGTLPVTDEKYIDHGMVTLREGMVIRGTGEGSSIQIQANALLIDGGRTKIKMKNSGDEGVIDIDLSDNLSLTGGGAITTAASGGNTAANIKIAVGGEGAVIAGMSDSGIPAGSEISSSATGGGKAGNISIVAGNSAIRIINGGTVRAVSTGFGSTAKAGDINLVSDSLTTGNGGQIINRASGESSGGRVTITSNTIGLSGEEPGIQSETAGSGDAGNITILPRQKSLVIMGDGIISANSTANATGNAGDIDIGTTGSDVLITDNAKISAMTSATGSGGNITVSGKNVDITNGAKLTAESQAGTANSPYAIGNPDSGRSGGISVIAADSFILDNGEIRLNTQQTDAGSIVIHSGRLFRMDNHSRVTTSVADGRGDGGDISINKHIDSNLVVLNDSSEIRANAKKGAGGNIEIRTYFHLISPDSTIDASAGPVGIDGSVTITTPDVDATTGILQLPESFLDASRLLSSRCSTRTTGNSSSFVVKSESNTTTPDNLLLGTVSYLKKSSKNGDKTRIKDMPENGIPSLIAKRLSASCR